MGCAPRGLNRRNFAPRIFYLLYFSCLSHLTILFAIKSLEDVHRPWGHIQTFEVTGLKSAGGGGAGGGKTCCGMQHSGLWRGEARRKVQACAQAQCQDPGEAALGVAGSWLFRDLHRAVGGEDAGLSVSPVREAGSAGVPKVSPI